MRVPHLVVCNCDRGLYFKAESLERVKERLRREGYKVHEYRGLCHSLKLFKELRRECGRIVIGACYEYMNVLLQMAVDAGFKPFNVRITPIYDFALAYGDHVKALTMLLEYYDGLSAGPKPPESSVKLNLPLIGRKMSRRQLLTSILKPSETSIPWVLDSCNGCGICIDICGENAISTGENGAIIDDLKCLACECCVGSCPSGSIASVQASPAVVHARLRRVALSGYRSVLFYCPKTRSEVLTWWKQQPPGVESLYPFELPCLTSLNPQVMMSMVYSGFKNLYVVKCVDNCYKAAVNLIRGYVSDTSKVARWDHRNISIVYGSIQNVKPAPPGRLEEFEALFKPLNEIFTSNVENSGIILFEATPVGFLEISDNCTACGVCADACPTGSLMVEEGGSYRVVFKHDTCIACGKCVQACPEGSIRMVRGLNTRLLGKNIVLFEIGKAKCRRCGKALGPATMLEKVSAKLKESGFEDSYVYLCTECRAKALLDLAE